ncbi:diadenosine 5',5'''-P1,P4-tetraphosphate asymmetrical hydrolase [Abortiporus biennis]|nr:diadenosine 5',5'''-P1,P4-tetraphosphate asymmetrical hydrolase [Abortiporus biennis]
MTANKLLFSTIEVTRQAFYKTSLAFAIVNLKPIVPGHVLVVPTRPVPRLADLNGPELSALMSAVQRVGKVIERVYGADALTIACQDGKAAGQSVPHVHFHLLPRKLHGDRFSENNDEIYPALEHSEANLSDVLAVSKSTKDLSKEGRFIEGVEPIKMDADEERKPRTMEEMVNEAEWLKGFFTETSQQENVDSTA